MLLSQVQGRRSGWKDLEFEFDPQTYLASCPTPGGIPNPTAFTTFYIFRTKRKVGVLETYDYNVSLEPRKDSPKRLAAVTGIKGGTCSIGRVTYEPRDSNCGFLEAAMKSCVLDQKRKGGFDPVKNDQKWRNHDLAKEAKKNCKSIIKVNLRDRTGDSKAMETVDDAAHAITAIQQLWDRTSKWDPWKVIVEPANVEVNTYDTLIQFLDRFAELFIPLDGRNPRDLPSSEQNYQELFDFIGRDFFLCECDPPSSDYCIKMHKLSNHDTVNMIVAIKNKLDLPRTEMP